MRRIPVRLAAALAVVALTAAACGSSDSKSDSSSEHEAGEGSRHVGHSASTDTTIVAVASQNPDFSTLVTAVTKAGLVKTLSGPGPFTVFAPTDAAFAAIPADQLNAILADKAQLTKILTYHVVPGEVMAADLQPSRWSRPSKARTSTSRSPTVRPRSTAATSSRPTSRPRTASSTSSTAC